MEIKQISVFSENKPGKLARITEILGAARINIRALTIAEAGDFGIVRLIVDRPDEAYELLKKERFAATETEVLAIEMPDEPGALSRISRILGDSNINIEYAYAFILPKLKNAALIAKVSDIKKAIKSLINEKITLIPSKDIYSL